MTLRFATAKLNEQSLPVIKQNPAIKFPDTSSVRDIYTETVTPTVSGSPIEFHTDATDNDVPAGVSVVFNYDNGEGPVTDNLTFTAASSMPEGVLESTLSVDESSIWIIPTTASETMFGQQYEHPVFATFSNQCFATGIELHSETLGTEITTDDIKINGGSILPKDDVVRSSTPKSRSAVSGTGLRDTLRAALGQNYGETYNLCDAIITATHSMKDYTEIWNERVNDVITQERNFLKESYPDMGVTLGSSKIFVFCAELETPAGTSYAGVSGGVTTTDRSYSGIFNTDNLIGVTDMPHRVSVFMEIIEPDDSLLQTLEISATNQVLLITSQSIGGLH